MFHFILSVAQIFFSLVLLSVELHKKRGQNLTGKNLNVNRQFFKDVIGIFDVDLFNLIAGGAGNTNSSKKLQPICPISIY